MAKAAQLVHNGTGKGGPFGIWQATIAGHVNVYLVKPDRGPAALVDAGPAGCADEIRALLAAAKVKPEQVDRIVLTHAHPNHAGGLAGARELLPKAELCTSAFDARYLRQPAGQVDDDLKRLKVLFRRWGAPSDSKDLVAAALGSYRSRRVWPESAAPAEITRELRDGTEVALGGAVFQVIEAPGHHAGALLFYHPATDSGGGELFSGDNVAMEPVPMPMLSTGRDGERIVSGPALVDGLERLKDLAPRIVFPGHGAVLGGPEHVLDEEIHFYRGRAQRLMAQLIDARMSAWEIAAESDPKKLVERISLVFCFLDLLLRESAIDCKLENGVDRYHVPL